MVVNLSLEECLPFFFLATRLQKILDANPWGLHPLAGAGSHLTGSFLVLEGGCVKQVSLLQRL